MAEIRVEEKRGSTSWVWLLLALAVAALLAWYFLSRRDDAVPDATVPATAPTDSVRPTSGAPGDLPASPTVPAAFPAAA